MAIIKDNLLVKGARGNVGKQFVYRKHGNNTTIARMPRINENAESTEEQLEKRELFTSAVMYAQGAIQSAELKKEYQKKAPPGKTAYNMALRDFLKAPVVKKINTEKYNGTPGSTIIIHAKDDFRVVAVKVSIYVASTGGLLEEGNATLAPINREQWIYTASQQYAEKEPLKIVATATDVPGNQAVLEIML